MIKLLNLLKNYNLLIELLNYKLINKIIKLFVISY